MEIVDTFVNTCIDYMSNLGYLAGVLLIILESIIPALPLSVFIALNTSAYGTVMGVIISWLSTIVGCTGSFLFFRYLFRDKFYKFVNKKDMKNLDNLMNKISDMPLTNLSILIAIPFSPAFLINIAAGLSKMKYRKFLLALLIGKLIMVYFWSYIGTTLLESITDIGVIIKIIGLLVLTYVISKLIEKKLGVK